MKYPLCREKDHVLDLKACKMPTVIVEKDVTCAHCRRLLGLGKYVEPRVVHLSKEVRTGGTAVLTPACGLFGKVDKSVYPHAKVTCKRCLKIIEASKPKLKLRLYVWDGVLTDYTSGIAFALARNVKEAKKLLVADGLVSGWERYLLYGVKVSVFNRGVAFHVYGGG
jgi:hypothetical protein